MVWRDQHHYLPRSERLSALQQRYPARAWTIGLHVPLTPHDSGNEDDRASIGRGSGVVQLLRPSSFDIKCQGLIEALLPLCRYCQEAIGAWNSDVGNNIL